MPLLTGHSDVNRGTDLSVDEGFRLHSHRPGAKRLHIRRGRHLPPEHISNGQSDGSKDDDFIP